jgi:NAD(P)-dependent dehydrogenase (short-subunit alcohol dehydrogenase family)
MTTRSKELFMRNDKRVWFVTGASRGFGRALSEAVLARGDRLIATARRPEFVDEFRERHPEALAVQLDVTDRNRARAAVAEGVERFGRLDVLVNNAGYGHFGAVEELTEEELRGQFEVNLFGVLNVTRAVLPQLSSLNGVEAMVGAGYYCAGKFAVEGLSESLAAEVAPLGIKVTVVEPGPHRTGFAGRESVRVAAPIDDYAETVGAARDALADMHGTQPGDPGRAALAIIAAVDAESPPLHLPLGEMALANIRDTLESRLEELEAWRELSSSTDLVAA